MRAAAFAARMCGKIGTKMPHPPERVAASPPTRIISLYETLAIVLLWNAGYKGVRVANTLYALYFTKAGGFLAEHHFEMAPVVGTVHAAPSQSKTNPVYA